MFAQAKKTILFASLPLVFVGAASAAGRPDYGGKMSLTVVKQEAQPLDAAGHVVVAEVIKGTNVSTGRIAWMDGSDVLFSEVADLDKAMGRRTASVRMSGTAFRCFSATSIRSRR